MNVKYKQKITVQKSIPQQVQANYPINFPSFQLSSQGMAQGPTEGPWNLKSFAIVPVWGMKFL